MKKLLIGTLFIGLASLGYSQNTNITAEEVKLSDVTITSVNFEYLDKVREGTLSERVFTLEKKASRFNLKESPFFNPGGLNLFRFTKRNDKIVATYNDDGKILSTQEVYNNILLPPTVREALYLAYPDWNLQKNKYLVSYNHRNGAKKVYKVQIRKDGIKKNLKFDVDGNGI